MNNVQKKVASAIAASALLLNLALPVFAASTMLENSGNGAGSTNATDVEVKAETFVVQDNQANITNNVSADANTGGNDANKNTGGDVSIETGDAMTEVGVSNTVNSNSAEVNCACATDADVLISGNGADSKNAAKLKLQNKTAVQQFNEANIKNYVDAYSDTGNNDANKNTGGDVTIETGDASTAVVISNAANANSAKIGNGGGSGSVSARIVGNGADSKNMIALGLHRTTALLQTNSANISNKVVAYSGTGENRANKNTGGDVSIETGDAMTGVGIDNMANFNWADLDCGCLTDVMAKIAGNGADSKNKIHAELKEVKEIAQFNDWYCGRGDWLKKWSKGRGKACNNVDAYSDTGNNRTRKNTGDPGGDPSVETGDAATFVEVENSGNVNSVGSSGPEFPFDFPGGGFSFNLNLSFNLVDLMAALGLS